MQQSFRLADGTVMKIMETAANQYRYMGAETLAGKNLRGRTEIQFFRDT